MVEPAGGLVADVKTRSPAVRSRTGFGYIFFPQRAAAAWRAISWRCSLVRARALAANHHAQCHSPEHRVFTGASSRALYEKRDRSLDHSEEPQLPPAHWAKGMVGKYYRPLKSQISFRIDNDVLAWLKSKGQGHLSRINAILSERMESECR